MLSMSVSSERGGYKYSEPPVKRHFDLPPKINAALKKFSASKNKSDVAVVQDALQAYFAGEQSQAQGIKNEVEESLRKVLLELGPQIMRASELGKKGKPAKGSM